MNNILLRCIVTFIALAGATLHVLLPSVEIDSVTGGFLIIAFLPWLAPIIKSVKIPIIGEIDFRDLERKIDEVKGAALSADHKAEFAIATGNEMAVEKALPTLQQKSQLDALAAEYKKIRESQRSGTARTSALTKLVSRMISVSAELPDAETAKYLQDRDAGKRIIGYAAMYANPRMKLLEQLTASVTEIEDQPFGQYWGILAISRVISTIEPEAVSGRMVDALREFLGGLGRGTDRYYELSRLLAAFK